MRLSYTEATEDQVDEVLKLRNAVEKKLIQDYGSGDWGFTITESIVRRGLKNGKILCK